MARGLTVGDSGGTVDGVGGGADALGVIVKELTVFNSMICFRRCSLRRFFRATTQ